MVKDLINHGITPNKSKTLKIKNNFQGFERDFYKRCFGMETDQLVNVVFKSFAQLLPNFHCNFKK